MALAVGWILLVVSGGITVSSDSSKGFDQLRIGDCIMTGNLGKNVESVPVVPCDQAHDAQISGLELLPAGAWPGQDAVHRGAADLCRKALQNFVGISYEESVLEFHSFTPTSAAWAAGDRSVLCDVSDPKGMTIGTLAGSHR
jgi:hypothetical protein